MQTIWLAFITGLTTGALSCLAVQGGLLASSVAPSSAEASEGQARSGKWQKVAMFLAAKIFAYTLLGFGLGALGSTFVISSALLGWMQILAGLFMLATAARLLNIHPIFRYFVIQPPKWAYKLMKGQSKSESLFAPALLGFLTILIPCGVTQAMMALAVASANPLYGAGIMLAFILGTSPIFFTVGMTAVELLKRKAFVYVTSIAIVLLGFLSINTGQVLRGSPHIVQNYLAAAKSLFGEDITNIGGVAKLTSDGKQDVVINARSNGYSSNIKQIKAGVPVKLTLLSNNVQSCAKSFLIPSLGISKILPENGTTTIEFTPTKTGRLAYTCGMGMYTGSFAVYN
ncbi:MAG: sulfite exporter TauE/SafE family protein [bacterium]|nr:sulfite exporter TauE/SafE family protein [bacterium]